MESGGYWVKVTTSKDTVFNSNGDPIGYTEVMWEGPFNSMADAVEYISEVGKPEMEVHSYA